MTVRAGKEVRVTKKQQSMEGKHPVVVVDPGANSKKTPVPDVERRIQEPIYAEIKVWSLSEEGPLLIGRPASRGPDSSLPSRLTGMPIARGVPVVIPVTTSLA